MLDAITALRRRLGDTVRRPATNVWPSIAAGLAATLGMGSCAVTVPSMGIVVAPFAAVIIATLVFALMLAARRPTGSSRERERAVRVATLVAWPVCVLMGGWEGHRANDLLTGLGPGGVSDGLFLGMGTGFLLGAGVAIMVMVVGQAIWVRRPPGEDDTPAAA